jgi:hypothetical protein
MQGAAVNNAEAVFFYHAILLTAAVARPNVARSQHSIIDAM